MNAFYASPAGRALADKLPKASNRAMDIAEQRMKDLMPRMKQLLDTQIRAATAAAPQ